MLSKILALTAAFALCGSPFTAPAVYAEDREEEVEDEIEEDEDFEGVDEDMKEEALEFLREHAPEIIPLLEEIRAIDEERYEDMIDHAAENLEFMEELAEEEPEEFAEEKNKKIADIRIALLAHKVRDAEPVGRKKLAGELRKALENRFDDAVEERRQEIEDLTAEIEELRSELESAVKNRKKLIERRLQEMIGEDDSGFDW